MADQAKHEWRRRLLLEMDDGIWDDADLLALPQSKQDEIEEILLQAARQLCGVVGHEPERDQCGRPEHDFCLWCRVRMPGAAGPDLRKAIS